MRIIIVGIGKVGYYLAKTLIKKGHNITLIDKREDICRRAAEELAVLVFCGDGSSINVLADAVSNKVDVFAAVTGSDEENLVICQTAKAKFGIKKTVARVKNPLNEKLFNELGIDIVISSTSLIAERIEC